MVNSPAPLSRTYAQKSWSVRPIVFVEMQPLSPPQVAQPIALGLTPSVVLVIF